MDLVYNKNCFGCGPENPIGLHLNIEWSDQTQIATATFQFTKEHASWHDTVHGGLVGLVLDEVIGWASWYQLQTSTVTARLNIRFRKPVAPYVPLRVDAKVADTGKRHMVGKGSLKTTDDMLLAEAEAVLMIPQTESEK